MQLQTGAPALQQYEVELDAPSQEIAIHRAMQRYPNVQFIHVSADQMDPQTQTPAQQQNAQTPTSSGQMPAFHPLQPKIGAVQPVQPLQNPFAKPQQPQAVPEAVHPSRFSYPYSISLPGRFGRLLKETAPGRVDTVDGLYMTTIKEMKEMHRFILNLRKNSDQDAARMVITGMRSSLG